MLLDCEYQAIAVNAQGQIITQDVHTAKYHSEDLGQEVTLEMVRITGGKFLMGAPEKELGWKKSQSPQHQVTVKDFFISKYPITQAQWQAVAKLPQVNQPLNSHPANFEGKNNPVEQISWYEAVEFCARLSNHSDYQYSLPSEAQWEYACRGSTTTPFHCGETITTDLANYSGIDWIYLDKVCSRGSYGEGPTGEDRRETTPVGHFQIANQFGLYDLHGNVREWCADYWHKNYQNAPDNGQPWITDGDKDKRPLRGGSWNGGPSKCRSGYRVAMDADASLYDIGFRVIINQ